MKIILVDAVNCFVSDEGQIFQPLNELLDTYVNKKIILTGAPREKFPTYNLHKMPYEVFTLEHNPKKTDRKYFEIMLKNFNLASSNVVYFEHNSEVVKIAQSVGIDTYYYDNEKKDLESLKKFLDENLK